MGMLHHGKVVEKNADGVMVTIPTLGTEDMQFGPCTVFGPEVFVGDAVLVGRIEDNKEDLVVVSGVNSDTLTFLDSATIDFTKTVVDADVTVTAIVKQDSIPLNDLSDVAVTSPATAQTLRYNGTSWINALLTLDDLGGVVITSPVTGQHLRYNGTAWINQDPLLDDNSDVNLTGQANGHFLRRSSGVWVPTTAALDDLSDVVVSSPSSGQTIRHNGTSFVNSKLSTADISNISGSPASGDVLIHDGTNWFVTKEIIDSAVVPSGGATLSSSGTEVVFATANYSDSHEINITFKNGWAYRIEFEGRVASSAATETQGAIRIRKGSATTAGLLLSEWVVECGRTFNSTTTGTLKGWIHNVSGADITTALSVCFVRTGSTNTPTLYGRVVVTVYPCGPATTTLTRIGTAIT